MAWTASFSLRILLMPMHSASCTSTVTSIALSMMIFKVTNFLPSLHCCSHKPEKELLISRGGKRKTYQLYCDICRCTGHILPWVSSAWIVGKLHFLLTFHLSLTPHVLFRCSLFGFVIFNSSVCELPPINYCLWANIKAQTRTVLSWFFVTSVTTTPLFVPPCNWMDKCQTVFQFLSWQLS